MNHYLGGQGMKRFILVLSVFASIGLVVWLFTLKQQGGGSDELQAGGAQFGSLASGQPVETTKASATPPAPETVETEEKKRELMFKILGEQVRTKMEGRLDNPYWHLKMLSDLKLHFQKWFPDNWKEALIAFLKQTFPDLAAELIQKLDRLIEYEAWIKALPATMHFNSQKERRQALWDKRLELFGDEAYEIFEAALKVDEFDAKMEALAESAASFSDKQQYIDAIRQVYGEYAVGPEAPNKTQMMTKFLSLDNVQQDLHALPPDELKQTLREFRSAMGLDEAALQRWEQLDQERAEQRSAGERYMELRQQLANEYHGEEFNKKVHELQVELFGETEAKYIRNEEASGYYRFNTPQKIGVN